MISKKLLLEGKNIATRDEIFEIARKIRKDEKRSLNYLLEEGYIVRILRGFFYIRSMEERYRKTQDLSTYQLVARALERKGIKNWYFALETALKLNLMTHEYFLRNYVVTDSYRTTKVIQVLGQDFLFIKRGEKQFDHGLVNKDGIWYSDRIKTILDLAYRSYLKNGELNEIKEIFQEYQRFIQKDQVKSYLKDFPRRFEETVEKIL